MNFYPLTPFSAPSCSVEVCTTAPPPLPDWGSAADHPATRGPPNISPRDRMNQFKAKLEQCEQFFYQRMRRLPNQPPVESRKTICQLGPATGNGPAPPRHRRGRHRPPHQQNVGASREREMDAYEADVEGLKEAMAVMCRELVSWGGYARHQVERVPHFAPPLVLNQFTQAPHGPPPLGCCTSDQGEGEGYVLVVPRGDCV